MTRYGGLLLIVLACATANADDEPKLPDLAPAVRTVIPSGGSAGITVEITLRGRQFTGKPELRFAEPDLKAEVVSNTFYEMKAKVQIGAKVLPGIHDFRLVTSRGSFVGQFHVSAYASTQEKEPNNDIAGAQKIALPAVVDALIEPNDNDHFRFHAEAGQTIVLEVVANRAASNLDARLAVLDERGEEVAFNDDWYIGGDPHIAFQAPRAGDYIAQVGDSSEFGNRDFSYRLLVGAFPYVERALPAGVQRGKVSELQLEGVNFESVTGVAIADALAPGEIVSRDAGRLTVRFSLPADTPAGKTKLYLTSKDGYTPFPTPVLISDAAESRLDTAGTRARPRPIAASSAISGVLRKGEPRHFYEVEAQAGKSLAFRVDSMRLGYLVDPAITLYDSSGKQLAHVDDVAPVSNLQRAELDPYLVYTFKEAGKYTVMVRDASLQTGSNAVYRFSVERAVPDFLLEAPGPTVTLYRGRSNTMQVRVKRSGGWDVPVEVWVESPPAGVTAASAVAEPKDSEYKDCCAKPQRINGTDVELKLQVAQDAAAQSVPLRIRARGVKDGRTVEHSLDLIVPPRFVAQFSGMVADRQVLGVVADLPPVVADVPQAFRLTAGKTEKLTTTFRRYDGGKEPLTMALDPPVAGVTLENL